MRPTRPAGAIRALHETDAGMRGRYNVTPAKRVNLTRYLYQVAGKPLAGSQLLDLGCGVGLECFAAALLGSKWAVGIEIDPIGLGHMRTVLENLRSAGFDCPVYPVKADLTGGIPFADESFDVILLIEAVSHIMNLEMLLGEALRVLRPGGAIIVQDSNNLLIRGKHRQNVELWEKWENGPRPGAEELPEHQRSYRAMRKHMIREAYPHLSEKEQEDLSAVTTGKYGEGISRVVEQYLATGVMSDRAYQRGTCPVAPDGRYMERLFDPYDLAHALREIGFASPTVKAHLTHGNRCRMVVDRLFGLLPAKLAMPWSRGFIVVARKSNIPAEERRSASLVDAGGG